MTSNALTPGSSSAFEQFLSEEFPDYTIEQISDSNNVVFRLQQGGTSLIAKRMLDEDIPLTYLVDASAQLAAGIRVQSIHHAYRLEAGDPFDAVVAEYVQGVDLVTVMSAMPVSVQAGLPAYLCRFLDACATMPRMYDGFALYKRETEVFGSLPEFVVYHANRWWSRVRPFCEQETVAIVDAWVAQELPGLVAASSWSGRVIPVDANLRNFVVTPDEETVCLNVPIAAYSSGAHSVAAVSTHLRNTDLYLPFRQLAKERICEIDDHLVAHFELWHLLGILSFYVARYPADRDIWQNWGSSVPLYQDFQSAAAAVRA